MKLLISPKNVDEAKEAIAGGADIIDVKNPKEGPLGANFPWVINEIKALVPIGKELSCTLGEAPNLPGTISLAAYGAASMDVDYVKVGLYGLGTLSDAVDFLEYVKLAVKGVNPRVKIVAAGYADNTRANSIDPLLVPDAAVKAQVDLAMLDTAVKDGQSLFDFLTSAQLKKFVDRSHGYGLDVALAGSLRKQDLPMLYSLKADIAGLRGAACSNGNRATGSIVKEKVHELVDVLADLSSTEKRL